MRVCQDQCISDEKCVGISYTFADVAKAPNCYICYDNELLPSTTDGFGFYLRQGKAKLWCFFFYVSLGHNSINDTDKHSLNNYVSFQILLMMKNLIIIVTTKE